ncbi:galactitol-1-phosphate 5-dehydrogenase [bacterium]|nr:galactitol-1-phosphate 5-dehydrogenase [bacterium]
MRALLLSEYQNLNVVEVEKPRLGPKDVLVSVKACGICGSDVHGYDGSSGRRIPPLVMGHEAAGVVTEIGAEVSRFSIGQRVTFDSMISCGNCHLCSKGSTNLCAGRRVLGVSCETYRQSGCFAEFVSVPEHIVYEIPDDLSFEHAALVEPVSVAVHAVSLLEIPSGASAVVVGTGMIGLLVVQALKVAGCDQIVAIDIDPFKLNLAKELGATHCLRATDVDVATEVLAITEGIGVDIAMEVVGKTEPLRTAIDCVRLGGQVGLVGNLQPNVDLPLQKVVTRELKLVGSCGSSGEYPRCIELMASEQIKVSPLISQVTSLDRGPEFFERLYKHEPELLKVVVQP